MGWSKGNMKIPAFAKGKLQKRIIPAEKDFFGDPIGQPQIIYFLSLPQFPKDSLIVYPEHAIQKGEIITAPIEHKTLYPEAVELLQEDYIPALIKAGCLTYTDDAIKRTPNLREAQSSWRMQQAIPSSIKDSEQTYWRS